LERQQKGFDRRSVLVERLVAGGSQNRDDGNTIAHIDEGQEVK
jgi:hypothetical protein